MAEDRRDGREIEYRCLDLSDAVAPEYRRSFDLIVSNLVIDDVPDYIGFVDTISGMAKAKSRIVLSRNNPYSAVIRGKVNDYFDTCRQVEYRGMATEGVNVFYYHRTMEEYIHQFSKHGYKLHRMSDLNPSPASLGKPESKSIDIVERYRHFPFLMVLEFGREI